MTDVFKTIVVPAARVEEARAIASQYPGGEIMFYTQATTDIGGAPPPTCYASSGWMDDRIPPALANVEGIDISDEQWPDAFARLMIRQVVNEL